MVLPRASIFVAVLVLLRRFKFTTILRYLLEYIERVVWITEKFWRDGNGEIYYTIELWAFLCPFRNISTRLYVKNLAVFIIYQHLFQTQNEWLIFKNAFYKINLVSDVFNIFEKHLAIYKEYIVWQEWKVSNTVEGNVCSMSHKRVT